MNERHLIEAHTGILPVDDKINKIQQLSGDKMVLSESGYMEIYVNNEAQTPVYFDNLSVTRSSGNAVEVNAYYSYGMIINSPSSGTIDKNTYSGGKISEVVISAPGKGRINPISPTIMRK